MPHVGSLVKNDFGSWAGQVLASPTFADLNGLTQTYPTRQPAPNRRSGSPMGWAAAQLQEGSPRWRGGAGLILQPHFVIYELSLAVVAGSGAVLVASSPG